jgi:hypothetical protein
MVWPVHSHLDQTGRSCQRREGKKSAGDEEEVGAGCSHEAPCSARAGRQQWEGRACWNWSSPRMGRGFGRRIAGWGVVTPGSGRDMPLGCSLRIAGLLRLAGSAGLVGKRLPGCSCIARRVRASERGARRAVGWVGSEGTSLGRVRFHRLGFAQVEGVI